MSNSAGSSRVGYVVKRYPRYSETFIVNELLAHQQAGLEMEIFSLRPPNDTHFQDSISRIRAPVHYLPHISVKGKELWEALRSFDGQMDRLNAGLAVADGAEALEFYQGVLLAREIQARGIDHLHAHFATSPATVTRLAARFANIGFSFTAHAKDIFHEDVDNEELATKLRDASVVVTVSDYNTQHLRQIAGDQDSHIVRIYNGLDLETHAFQSPAERPPVIVAVGRLVEKKGFVDLVEACSLLSRAGDPFVCRIVGTGPLEGALRNQIEERGLEGLVTLTGPLPQDEVRREVQHAAVLAAPCVVGEDGNRDGLPTTLLEAMALGTPCISTSVTGIPEAIQHQETGLIVDQHDPKGLAEALRKLLDQPPLREHLALNARRLIEEEFDALKNAGRLRTLFGSKTASQAPRRVA